jgi:NAD(P)-dependent dehydrogenase (short-subunit alcohol dehydrogenase family)
MESRGRQIGVSDLEGKVVLVTGAASGIGRMSAQKFAQDGAQVVLSDISESAGQHAATQILDAGGKATFVPADVSQYAHCSALVDNVIEKFGHLDVAVNNAGVNGAFGRLQDCSPDTWNRVIAINLSGVFHCLSAEIKAMQTRGGAIVNVASILGLIGAPGVSAYCASKHGVIGLTKTAALECGKYNIRINAVCPGFVDTPMVEPSPQVSSLVKRAAIRRLGNPSEIADAIVWLCSEKSSFVTGAALQIDGGITSA